MAKRQRTKEEKTAFYKKAIIALVVLVAMCVIIGVALSKVDSKILPTGVDSNTNLETGQAEANPPEIEEDPQIGLKKGDKIGSVIYKEEQYVHKNNLECYLVMGIDTNDKIANGPLYHTGQSDALFLAVYNRATGEVKQLPIDRDTMIRMKIYDENGKYLGLSDAQACLSHAYVVGNHESCANVVDAVSNYLYGQKINGYLSVNLNAIKIINHAVGGVKVKIEDDFSKQDPSLVKGETILLSDEQAVTYVRGRRYVGDGENIGRMRTQATYLNALETKLRKNYSDRPEFFTGLYEDLTPYMVTDMSSKTFSKLALSALQGNRVETVNIEGNHKVGDSGFMEFTPDQESLEKAIIQLFYEKDI